MKYQPLLFLVILFTLVSCSNSDDNDPSEMGLTVSDLTISIEENPVEGDIIGIVEANSDQGSITYSLESQFPEGAMSIHPTTGALSVVVPWQFDFQINPTLVASITVNDGVSSDTAQVTVNLTERTHVFIGSMELKTQAEVDAFGAQRYTEMSGYLIIGGLEGEDIYDLSPLMGLNRIGNYLGISLNENLTSLNGLETVIDIAVFLEITNNSQLNSILGLRNLRNIGDPQFLESGNLSVASNPALENLNGFENLTNIPEHLFIYNNDLLRSIDGLSNLIASGAIWIIDNDQLTNLNGLLSVSMISNELNISDNGPLSDLCGLTTAAQNNGISPELYVVENNNFNPTLQDLIEGYCNL